MCFVSVYNLQVLGVISSVVARSVCVCVFRPCSEEGEGKGGSVRGDRTGRGGGTEGNGGGEREGFVIQPIATPSLSLSLLSVGFCVCVSVSVFTSD